MIKFDWFDKSSGLIEFERFATKEDMCEVLCKYKAGDKVIVRRDAVCTANGEKGIIKRGTELTVKSVYINNEKVSCRVLTVEHILYQELKNYEAHDGVFNLRACSDADTSINIEINERFVVPDCPDWESIARRKEVEDMKDERRKKVSRILGLIILAVACMFTKVTMRNTEGYFKWVILVSYIVVLIIVEWMCFTVPAINDKYARVSKK